MYVTKNARSTSPLPNNQLSLSQRLTAHAGLLAGIACYAMWGTLPIFFNALKTATPLEILAHRVVWSLVFCLVVVLLAKKWHTFTAALRKASVVRTLAIATVLILCNWLTYVFAVSSGHVLDASLGYYINPLVTIILAVLILTERVSKLTWVALGFGAVAVLVMTAGMGNFPWISVVLALSFGFYGLIKSRIGASVDSLTSLSIETLLATPFAVGYLLWLSARGDSSFGGVDTTHTLLLVSTGVITALPLIFFGYAAQHLKLATLGILQYLGPTIQFLIGLFVFQESMPTTRWIGFVLVWIAVMLATIAAARQSRSVA
jgi:chloramphenicol-sensitive protein RarD